jgi:tetratricopeptide (TPR) repeat protein
VVGLHLALLAAAVALFYRTARRFMPGSWAAVAAGFPLLCESARALIAVPVHFVDVGLIAFSAAALHEAAAGRLVTSLAALAAAFGCKETAVATAAILPWLAPRPAAARAPARGGPWVRWLRPRLPWLAGTGAVSAVWAVLYLVARASAGLALPRGLESGLGTLPATLLERTGWAIVGTARALFSLPLARTGRDLPAGAALALLFLAAAVALARDAAARARLARIAPVVIAGILWCAAATAPLVAVYPIWSPQRAVYGGIGAGVALAAALGAAHPALLAALVAIRLALFALAPGPPARISNLPPETGAFVDFERLIRVQKMVAETRAALAARCPTLPPGSRVGLFNPPIMTSYAFGGSRALQTWYRDTTLRWVRYDEMYRRPRMPLAAVVTYQADGNPQVRLIDPVSFGHYLLAGRRAQQNDWQAALDELALADSIAGPGQTPQYQGVIAGRRAFCWLGLGRSDDSEREARRSLALWPYASDARYTLASLLGLAGRRAEAEAQLDTLVSHHPEEERMARALHDSLAVWTPQGK